jgi:hypothetical protein
MHEHTEDENVAFNQAFETVPFPEPIPMPTPWPPDWWRCLRRGAVSGRYYGEMTAPNAGRHALDLRVDIDPRHANSPVMDRVSGDSFQVFRFNWGGRVYKWRIYRESWIIDSPSVTWYRCRVEISGTVRYWKGVHADTDVVISIPWGSFTQAGPATVTFTEVGGSNSSYSCARQSSAFRTVKLEVDVCQSINAAPILPSYHTQAHSNRPAGLPGRTLTIEESYLEAGIDLTINPARSIIDDTALADTNWLPSELHDSMETYFSQIGGSWPKWQVWALLASGVFEDPIDGLRPGVGGIMFDASVPGGSYEPPERQGCTVFREHWWFDNLVATPPANDAQAWAMRHFLYTYVHEIGHAFNFLHSWDKGRHDALSWMNYDWKYDARNGDGTFWANFEFRFDPEELIHLRHGDRSSVIMGGDPWSSGWHMESPPGAMASMEGDAPVELLLRSKNFFQFMEPVTIEFRLRNRSDLPIELHTQLHPEYGGVVVYIRRPDGRILEYAPVLCKLATLKPQVLKAKGAVKGEDRHSQNIFLSYGSFGYYFDEPGEYLVRAVYQGSGNMLIPSNVHRVRIGRPYSHEEERIAQDLFSYKAGMALYLNGSSSPHLEKGMATLEELAERYRENTVGAQMSLVLARNQACPFRRVDEENVRVKIRDADPESALAFTTQALAQQERDDQTLSNIAYNQTCRTKAKLMAGMGQKAEAKKELDALVEYLKKRGVNQPVLDEIKAYASGL